MAFYDLDKEERKKLVGKIDNTILRSIKKTGRDDIVQYFSDDDTYIRKAGYLAVGKIYKAEPQLLGQIKEILAALYRSEDYHIRQTVVNAAGEIGKSDFESVQQYFDDALFDDHHTVRNAVIGSVKKMGQVNPLPVLSWAQGYLEHPDKEIRREICHGIELRGRTHPEDILSMLQQLEWDKTARVRNTLVHVLGQIAYKKGCLEKVVAHLQQWDNKQLVAEALDEIIDVHHRYRDFAYYTQQQSKDYINKTYKS